MAKVGKEIGSSRLARNIETLLREHGYLKSNKKVHSLEIFAGDKSELIIKVFHRDSQQLLVKVPKKPKPGVVVTSVSGRRPGMRKLQLIPGLRVEIVKALNKKGIIRVAAIRKMPLGKVLLIKNISKTRVRELKKALADIGVVLDWDI